MTYRFVPRKGVAGGLAQRIPGGKHTFGRENSGGITRSAALRRAARDTVRATRLRCQGTVLRVDLRGPAVRRNCGRRIKGSPGETPKLPCSSDAFAPKDTAG